MTPAAAMAAEAPPAAHRHLAGRYGGWVASSSRYRIVTIQPARATRSNSLGSLSCFAMHACCAESTPKFFPGEGRRWRVSG